MRVEADSLAARLKKVVEGEVRFDNGNRALYATDASNYRQTPIGVVIPKSDADVIATLALCREYGAAVTTRGGGTSLAGQCCNVAVILDFSKYMNRVLEIDSRRKIARVQPGCVCDRLQDEAEKHNLAFGPDPATHAWCTIGGMLGNNSCGVHSQMAGRTSDNVESLDIVTYDGERLLVGRTSAVDLARIREEGGRKSDIYQQLEKLSRKYGDLIRQRQSAPTVPGSGDGISPGSLVMP